MNMTSCSCKKCIVQRFFRPFALPMERPSVTTRFCRRSVPRTDAFDTKRSRRRTPEAARYVSLPRQGPAGLPLRRPRDAQAGEEAVVDGLGVAGEALVV